MRDEPGIADLLDGARESLLENILPSVAKERRRDVLMIANALAIARRMSVSGEEPLRAELRALQSIYDLDPDPEPQGQALHDKLHELNTRLTHDIRAGAFDERGAGRDAALALLWSVTVAKLRENRPKMLKAEGVE